MNTEPLAQFADSPPTDAQLWRLAAGQAGVVSVTQARTIGIGRHGVQHRTLTGEWVRHSKRVIAHSASPQSEHQQAMAAVIDAGPGAALSHSSAAALWGIPGFRLFPWHVTITRRSHTVARSLGHIHRMRALQPEHVTELQSIPIVRPELMMLQLAGIVHPSRVGILLDRAWSMRLLSGKSTRMLLDVIGTFGVRGVQALRSALDERPADYVPSASNLESRFAQIIRNAGLPAMRSQVDLGEERWCGRVDFFADDRALVIEVDSERFHSALSDVAADKRREQHLRASGFVVGRVTDTQVFHRPWEVVELVRRLRMMHR